MIDCVLLAPINLYFDTTPIGRIINRFTKDLSLLETTILYIIGTTLSTLYQLVAVMLMAVIVVPWIGLFFPIVAMLLYHFYKNAISAKKEVQRIESVTKSPLLSFQSEIISGSSTIRAYQKKDDFIERSNEFLNDNIVANQWSEGVPFWFAIRIDIVAIVMMSLISVLCVLSRNSTDPVMLAMTLTYALTVQANTAQSIRCIM